MNPTYCLEILACLNSRVWLQLRRSFPKPTPPLGTPYLIAPVQEFRIPNQMDLAERGFKRQAWTRFRENRSFKDFARSCVRTCVFNKRRQNTCCDKSAKTDKTRCSHACRPTNALPETAESEHAIAQKKQHLFSTGGRAHPLLPWQPTKIFLSFRISRDPCFVPATLDVPWLHADEENKQGRDRMASLRKRGAPETQAQNHQQRKKGAQKNCT